MSTLLLDSLSSETTLFTDSGKDSLDGILGVCDNFLEELKLTKAALEEQLVEEGNGIDRDNKDDPFENLQKSSDNWYNESIVYLKTYNASINKFLKNILNNSKFNVDLDEAYTYPLNLNNFPVKYNQHDLTESPTNLTPDITNDIRAIKLQNHGELIKAIIIHLLKIGQCDLVKDMIKEIDPEGTLMVDETLLEKFKLLNEIVDDIVVRHDLSKVLHWFKDKYNSDKSGSRGVGGISQPIRLSHHYEIEFKFHMLQFTILLNGDQEKRSFDLDRVLAAYLYAKDNFSKFFKDYLHEISPLMTLLLFKTTQDENNSQQYMANMLSEFITKMKQSFNADQNSRTGQYKQSQFIGEILANFENIHGNQSIFVNLSNEFISDYCKDLNLSNDSSIFQSVLAGFINLPSFYKYNKIQMKLNKVSKVSQSITTLPTPGNDTTGNNGTSYGISSGDGTIVNFEASYHYDLPFQLPDSNKFLFNYHPIFICPVSKEQLIPITLDDEYQLDQEHITKKIKMTQANADILSFMQNPVVVLKFCQHLALRDSVWQLSKKGSEIFKCHYCYKKHKFSDVSDAYFIDL